MGRIYRPVMDAFSQEVGMDIWAKTLLLQVLTVIVVVVVSLLTTAPEANQIVPGHQKATSDKFQQEEC